jgi:hypothetical protein
MKYVIVILLAIVLAACASPVKMSEQQRQACAAVANTERPCTVWTLPELQDMARYFFGEGFKAGRSSL